MSNQHGLRNDRPQAARSQKPEQSNDDVDEKNEEVAHTIRKVQEKGHFQYEDVLQPQQDVSRLSHRSSRNDEGEHLQRAACLSAAIGPASEQGGAWLLRIGHGAVGKLVILDADVFQDLAAGHAQLCGKCHVEWFGKGPRVVNRHHTAQCREIDAGPPLYQVELLAVRRAGAVQPESVVQANGVDNECVSFPPAD